MENKYTVKELVEAISSMSKLDRVVICEIFEGCERISSTKHFIGSYKNIEEASQKPDLIHAIANWNTDFPAHKDDAILTLLDELLESVICQQQPGKDQDTKKLAGP